MQPRSKKGPSWKDDDALPAPEPVASTSTSNTTKPLVPPSEQSSNAVESEDQHEPTKDDPVSDMDWLKQRTKASVDSSADRTERVFEQSDDEGEAGPVKPEVIVSSPALVTAISTHTYLDRAINT